LRELTEAGGAPLAVFALIVLGSVFAAVAVTRQDLHMQTQALQRTFASVPAVENSVVATAGWTHLDASPDNPNAALTPSDLDVETSTLARQISSYSLPLAPPSSDWAGITSGYTAFSGGHGAGSAGFELEIGYRSALGRHARLVAGRQPDYSTVRFNPGGAAVRDATLQIAMTQATAARLGVGPGSRLTAAGRVTLVITGIIRPADPDSAFWTLDSVAARPAIGSAGAWLGSAFVGPAELRDLQLVLGSPEMTAWWDFPLALSGVQGTAAGPLAAHLKGVSGADLGAGQVIGVTEVAPGAIAVSSALSARLTSFAQTQTAVDAVLSVLLTGLAVIGSVAVLLCVHVLTGRRAGEFAMLIARGASATQLAATAARAGIVTMPAAVAGLLLGVGATRGDDVPLAWWLGGAIALVALAAPPAAAARWHRAVARPKRRAGRMARARRLVAEVALVAAAVGGLVVLRQQGTQPGDLDVYTAAAPVLVAVPAAAFVLRLLPLAMRGLLPLTAARRGVVAFVAMARAARSAPAVTLPAFGLILALGVAAFGGMVRDAVQSGQVLASWQLTGADAVIDDSASPSGISPGAMRAIAGVPGAGHVAAVRILAGSLPFGAAADIIVVNPEDYAGLLAATPLPGFPAAALAPPPRRNAPVPAVASANIAVSFHSGTVMLPSTAGRSMNVRVAATVAATPADLGQDLFLVLPSWAFSKLPPPGLLLVTGPHLDQAALAAAVRRTMPNAELRLRANTLDGLTGMPLQQGAEAVFASGLAAAAGLSALILLLTLALAAEERAQALARLHSMGLAAGQGTRMVIFEAAPVLLAAVTAGVICAWLLAPLTGSSLDLSAFTDGAATVPVQADFTTLAIPPAGLVLLALAVLSVEAAAVRRFGMLRRLHLDS
jgi:putative ABC transport system permease protein